jgi:hypothetical protein
MLNTFNKTEQHFGLLTKQKMCSGHNFHKGENQAGPTVDE